MLPSENKDLDELVKMGYGLEGKIDELRSKGFSRLAGQVYLDHAGAALHSETQLSEVFSRLNQSVLGNPHSLSNSGKDTGGLADKAREIVLASFCTTPSEYSVIFTSGATGGLRLLGESFPWSTRSELCCLLDNHNSVLGMRQYALAAGARFSSVDGDLKCCCSPALHSASQAQAVSEKDKDKEPGTAYSLFAYPAESNFSGARYDLGWIAQAQAGRLGHTGTLGPEDSKKASPRKAEWLVLLDAAKYCSTATLDLSLYKPDFVVLSFYKLFGYPTGLGALLVRQDRAHLLRKRYFGGGTVEASVSNEDYVVFRSELARRFEDGTIAFSSIAALEAGYKLLGSLTMPAISKHTAALTQFLVTKLRAMKHGTGQQLCEIFGHDGQLEYGPVVCFNLRDAQGAYIGYTEVEKMASAANIHLRTGCFCNPGACQSFLQLSPEQIREHNRQGHKCWDDKDVIQGRPTGAVRVSLGFSSTLGDVQRFLSFVRTYFLSLSADKTGTQKGPAPAPDAKEAKQSEILLQSITLYPIKSCGGQSVQSWPLGPHGLLLDREWTLVDDSALALSMKRFPHMCLIQPLIDLDKGTLTVTAPNLEPLVLPLPSNPGNAEGKAAKQLQVSGAGNSGHVYPEEVSDWFSRAVGRRCHLARYAPEPQQQPEQAALGTGESKQASDQDEQCKAKPTSERSKPDKGFANEGQFLLVSASSVEAVKRESEARHGQDVLMDSGDDTVVPARFRPNFVVSGAPAFAEDAWLSVTMDSVRFEVAGPCTRCTMVNIDQQSGTRQSNLFATLSAVRKREGKIVFGALLNQPTQTQAQQVTLAVRVGMRVTPQSRDKGSQDTLPAVCSR